MFMIPEQDKTMNNEENMPEKIIAVHDNFTVTENKNINTQYLNHKGVRIAEVLYGSYLDRHKSIENWIDKVNSRDEKRMMKIKQQIDILNQEYAKLFVRWYVDE